MQTGAHSPHLQRPRHGRRRAHHSCPLMLARGKQAGPVVIGSRVPGCGLRGEVAGGVHAVAAPVPLPNRTGAQVTRLPPPAVWEMRWRNGLVSTPRCARVRNLRPNAPCENRLTQLTAFLQGAVAGVLVGGSGAAAWGHVQGGTGLASEPGAHRRMLRRATACWACCSAVRALGPARAARALAACPPTPPHPHTHLRSSARRTSSSWNTWRVRSAMPCTTPRHSMQSTALQLRHSLPCTARGQQLRSDGNSTEPPPRPFPCPPAPRAQGSR